jgi:hypothetical protein
MSISNQQGFEVRKVSDVSVEITDLPSGKTMLMTSYPEAIRKGATDYARGELLQNAFPFLNPDEREFLLTGTTPEEWNAMFGEGE